MKLFTGHPNIKTIFLPPVAGLVVAFIALHLYMQVEDWKYYLPEEDVRMFHFTWVDYLLMYSIVFVLFLAGAIIFQYFIAIPIWKKYKTGKKFLQLGVWPLIVSTSLLLSIALFILFVDKHSMSYQNPVFFISSAFIISMVYWMGNVFMLKKLNHNEPR